jgi:hypothetical protein
MPTYISQDRYTREAIEGMIDPTEDRAAEVARPLGKVGGAAALLAAGRGGGVTDLKTTLAYSFKSAAGA